jgi:hypothetical protein
MPNLPWKLSSESSKSLTRFYSDLTMSRSIARAVAQDGNIIASHSMVEEQATHDRDQALGWDSAPVAPRSVVSPTPEPDDELLRKMQALYMDDEAWPSVSEAESSGDTAICLQCGSHTCTICKGPFHEASGCPEDPWKHCPCDQWDEDRLVARANVIVDRDMPEANANVARRDRLVHHERRNLIQNHQCTHDRWRGRGGSYQCEECLDTLPQFIYECRQCHILACRRCRFNRL